MLIRVSAVAAAIALSTALVGFATAQEPPTVERSEAFAEEVSDAIMEQAPEEPEGAEEEQAEEPPESDYEAVWDAEWQEDYPEPVYEYVGGYSGSEATTLGDLLNGQGRAYDESGQSYTYYGDVLGHLDIPGENVDEYGVIHDGDGYIVVAADSYERGEIIETPYGPAKNYDSGGGYNNIDIYTNR